jgi:hypothetical protein
VLEALDNTRVRLKVALSYFVEPNPSFATNLDPARYQSFGLRFDLKRSRETIGNFNRRNNAEGYDKDARARSMKRTTAGYLAKSRSPRVRCMSTSGRALLSNLPPAMLYMSIRSQDGGESANRSEDMTKRRATRL